MRSPSQPSAKFTIQVAGWLTPRFTALTELQLRYVLATLWRVGSGLGSPKPNISFEGGHKTIPLDWQGKWTNTKDKAKLWRKITDTLPNDWVPINFSLCCYIVVYSHLKKCLIETLGNPTKHRYLNIDYDTDHDDNDGDKNSMIPHKILHFNITFGIQNKF